MKHIIILFSIIVATMAEGFTSDQANKIKETSRVCIKATGVDIALVKRVKEGDIVDDSKVKEFVSCVLQKLNMQNADGSFNNDLIKTNLPSGLSQAEKDNVMQKCVTEVGSSVADTAWRAYKCYRENSPLNFSENL